MSDAGMSHRPTQAVILAGGRGSRLAPLTDKLPKPMIAFHGKPFLEYLIELLRDQGFKRVLLLLGYLPETVQNYFGNGSRWNLDIEYSVSPAEDETGRRLQLARSRMDEIFLMMYCDNYWPMAFEPMWRDFIKKDVALQITVYRNQDKSTRDNLLLDSEGYVRKYDKSRKTPGLSGVDIGFALVRKSVMDRLPDGNVNFEAEVYPRLAEEGKLGAYVTDHRYYSVGSLEKLPLTEKFLERRPAVFLDRDGVLNKKMPRAEYVCDWSQWEWLAGAKEALKLFKQTGYQVILITNQPGIARGAMTLAALNDIHGKMKREIEAGGGRLDAIYYCPHDWNEGCACRKPKPGLLFQAQHDLNLDLSRTCFIGDDERDMQAAQSAGCPWIFISDELSFLDAAKGLLKS